MPSTIQPGLTIRGGVLRKVVTIQQPYMVGSVQKWQTFMSGVRASISPIPGTEVARQEEPTNVVMSNVAIRYRPGLKAKMRILFGTRTLEINSVINVEELNRELNLVCREVIN